MSIKPHRHHIRTLIGVSAVYALTALLAALLTFLGGHFARLPGTGEWPGFLLAAGVSALIAFACGFAVTRYVLRPAQRFIERTDDLLSVAALEDESPQGHHLGVFDQVENLLKNLDTRQLFPEIVFAGPGMDALLRQVRMLAPTEADVLISGEDGTGKTLMAETIHIHSPRRDGPFIQFACGPQPAELLEGELFGWQGPVAGPTKRHEAGKLAQAHGGTLFLHEIADLPMALQTRLVDTLATGPFERAGRTQPVSVDVRLIASTTRDLEEKLEAGVFHRALYDRLHLFRIQLPPLRDRIEDVPLLAACFLPEPSDRPVFTPAALQALIGYVWPGNVRELAEVIEQAAARSGGETIDGAHLPAPIREATHPVAPGERSSHRPLGIDERLQAIEKRMIEDALKQTGGIQVRAAALMGINQRSLWHRIKKYRIDAGVFKKKRLSSS